MTTPAIHITDTELLTLVGFRKESEHSLICAFAAERGLSVRALLAVALRSYHTQTVIGPEYMLRHLMGEQVGPPKAGTYLQPPRPGDPDHHPVGCPDLGDAGPFDCGHEGWLSIHPRADGGSQCTACANAMRRANGEIDEPSV